MLRIPPEVAQFTRYAGVIIRNAIKHLMPQLKLPYAPQLVIR